MLRELSYLNRIMLHLNLCWETIMNQLTEKSTYCLAPLGMLFINEKSGTEMSSVMSCHSVKLGDSQSKLSRSSCALFHFHMNRECSMARRGKVLVKRKKCASKMRWEWCHELDSSSLKICRCMDADLQPPLCIVL